MRETPSVDSNSMAIDVTQIQQCGAHLSVDDPSSSIGETAYSAGPGEERGSVFDLSRYARAEFIYI
jgi:hypothetical protein